MVLPRCPFRLPRAIRSYKLKRNTIGLGSFGSRAENPPQLAPGSPTVAPSVPGVKQCCQWCPAGAGKNGLHRQFTMVHAMADPLLVA
jgi:hypothetical protein